MPEGPEVETMCAAIRPFVGYLMCVEIIGEHKILKNTTPAEFVMKTDMTTIIEIARHGKWLELVLARDDVPTFRVYIHNGMYGHIIVTHFDKEVALHKHDRVLFIVQKDDVGDIISYRDTRCWGRIHIEPYERIPEYIKKLGPDAMTTTHEELQTQILRSHDMSLGYALMDQSFVAGIGNIYRSEIMFAAGVSPYRKLSQLTDTEIIDIAKYSQEILGSATIYGGSSISDYVRPSGESGSAQFLHKVYGRGGKPCSVCHNPIKVELDINRKVYFCETCQK